MDGGALGLHDSRCCDGLYLWDLDGYRLRRSRRLGWRHRRLEPPPAESKARVAARRSTSSGAANATLLPWLLLLLPFLPAPNTAREPLPGGAGQYGGDIPLAVLGTPLHLPSHAAAAALLLFLLSLPVVGCQDESRRRQWLEARHKVCVHVLHPLLLLRPQQVHRGEGVHLLSGHEALLPPHCRRLAVPQLVQGGVRLLHQALDVRPGQHQAPQAGDQQRPRNPEPGAAIHIWGSQCQVIVAPLGGHPTPSPQPHISSPGGRRSGRGLKLV
mmetsp:Transcript_36951/g.104277  ORF Transcript_36951/g.104277 Transcript_36951/m.104277 type:complete len:271 (+) Transcript_36951:1398-2210(+)